MLPGLVDDVGFTAEVLDAKRPVGDTLMGAAIVDLGRRGAFVERWASVFEFRDAGAAWGLVALDQGVDRSPLLGAVTRAVESSGWPSASPRSGRGRTSTKGGSTATTVPGRGDHAHHRDPAAAATTTRAGTHDPGSPRRAGLLGPVLEPGHRPPRRAHQRPARRPLHQREPDRSLGVRGEPQGGP